jgi:DNA ligase D-like protein (predicted ligase)
MHIKNEAEAKRSKTKVFYYAFDVMFYDGYDLTELKIIDRKKVLRGMINFNDPLRFTQHRNKTGEKYHSEGCKKGWEGIIAKKKDSSYSHRRSSDWLKLKCVNQQEFVIGGYTDPQGDRIGFGALLIGFYKNGKLHYAGKVGTGFDNDTLKMLYRKLSGINTDEPGFDEKKDMPSKNINWVKPKLVAEIGFTEWTKDEKLRHPRYLGLRRDKNPIKIKKES